MAYMQKLRDIPVTTTDLKEPYEVLGPVFFNTTNKGVFSSAFTKLCEKYTKEPYSVLVKRPGGESIQTGEFGSFLLSLFDLGGGYEGSVGQWQFDDAYYYSIAELKLRCAEMGGDAVVGMSMDFDLDTNNAAAFYLQMHGTAVKLK
ncbi:MAG: heavy metal-binding domain-containing protein [Oscillospiraceae bacterium]|nr:heavy metal-binding domain-containing protein [Oscillospiraceae bacterium]